MTITVDELLIEMRLGDSTEERALCQRRLAFSTEAVKKYVGAAFDDMPDSVANEGGIRLSAFHFDMPTSGASDRYANPLRSSGAARLLTAYRQHGGGLGL